MRGISGGRGPIRLKHVSIGHIAGSRFSTTTRKSTTPRLRRTSPSAKQIGLRTPTAAVGRWQGSSAGPVIRNALARRGRKWYLRLEGPSANSANPMQMGAPISAARQVKIPTSIRLFGRTDGIFRRDVVQKMRLSIGRMGGRWFRGSKLEVANRSMLREKP